MTEKYVFITVDRRNLVYLICNECLAVCKEYNLRRHLKTAHANALMSLSHWALLLGSRRFRASNLVMSEDVKLYFGPLRIKSECHCLLFERRFPPFEPTQLGVVGQG